MKDILLSNLNEMTTPITYKKATWQNLLEINKDWLLNSNSYTRYKTLIDLLEFPHDDELVLNSHSALLKEPKIIQLINDSCEWFPTITKRHNDSTMSHYKLRMLADFGLNINQPKIKQIAEKLKTHKIAEMFAIRQQLPDKNAPINKEWYALPCDSPLLSYILLALGDNSEDLQYSVNNLKNHWITSEGWFCNLLFVNSQFKKYRIGCPMASLVSLEVFSMDKKLHKKGIVKNAFEPLDFHRKFKQSVYYFGRSKRFWTFKYPFVWYNAFYIAEVLTRFKQLRNKELLKEIIDWIENSFDKKGRITANSMFMAYKDWDFANKNEASPWLTFLAYRILKRYYE
jgi:hypothetical protein